ncbi:hypothetical protein C8R47DRAFT_1155003, partial [Mycena vitilis]
MWGPEEDLDALQAAVTDADDAPTAEGQLWDLYYSILHAAKKTPWRDVAAQQRLVDLAAALKARPNPPHPVRMTIPASRNWVWEGGAYLWSNQIMFGPSARETWNDSPGCGAGWRVPEVRAWTNVNAFVARLSAQGVRDFRLYGMWALREALEDEIAIGGHHPAESVSWMAEALFEGAAVWVRLAGRCIHARLQEEYSLSLRRSGRNGTGGSMRRRRRGDIRRLLRIWLRNVRSSWRRSRRAFGRTTS